jgi:hypothetical protein
MHQNQIIRTNCFLLVLVLLAHFLAVSTPAQTYTWADNAQGQIYLICPGSPDTTNYYPNDSLWSQSLETNANCNNSGSIVSEPSNWNPAPGIGIYPGGPGAIGADVFLGAPANAVLNTQVTLGNVTIGDSGGLEMEFSSSILTGALDLQGAGGITVGGGGGPFPILTVTPGGTLTKSGGPGVTTLDPSLTVFGTGITIGVDSGTLALTGNSSSYTNCVFSVAEDSTLNLVSAGGGGAATFSGTFSGSGAGMVLLNGGTLYAGTGGAIFNLPGSLLQWEGGTIANQLNDLFFTNTGTINLSGTASPVIAGRFENLGTMIQNNSGPMSINFSSTFDNLPGAMFNFGSDAGIAFGGGGGQYPQFNNQGVVLKSAGTGVSQIAVTFNDLGGTVEVQSGVLALTSGGSSSNGTFNASMGATLDLVPANQTSTFAGLFTGSGAGTVTLANGTLQAAGAGVTFNFPGTLFQWTGGTIASSFNVPFTNAGAMTISAGVGVSDFFANAGQISETTNGSLNIPFGSAMNNLAGATFDLQGTNSITGDGGGGPSPQFNNEGLVLKSAGAGVSQIAVPFNNLGGTVDVQSGVLALTDGGSSSNGTFNASLGATLDLVSPNQTLTFAGLFTGSGAGTVTLANGTLQAVGAGVTFNFPGTLFQWAGGTIYSTPNVPFTNAGAMTISAGVGITGFFANAGQINETTNGSLNIPFGSFMNNLAGATFDLQGTNGITGGGGGGGGPVINNYGTFQKSGGGPVAQLASDITFNNYGTISAQSGTILFNYTYNQLAGQTILAGGSISTVNTIAINGGSVSGAGSISGSLQNGGGVVSPSLAAALNILGNYAQGGGGTLNIMVGGNGNQAALLNVSGNASLAGTLTVTETNGFAPAVGTQFQILSASGADGAFATANLPAGLSLTYSNNGVFLVVTSAVAVQIIAPELSGKAFSLDFPTANGQSYTVQQTTNLPATNWKYYTNITGNGSPAQIPVSTTNGPRNFYRISEP